MKHLEEQYIGGTIAPEGLDKLRGQVNALDDDSLEESMRERWMGDGIAVAGVADDQLLRMKRNIDDRVGTGRTRVARMVLRGVAAVAAVLVPALIVSTIYLYRQNSRLASSDLTFTTAKGERATVALPDGTSVTLNYDSRLVYSPATYNHGERRVSFSGEAWFRVARNPERPFLIDADRLQVKVLGTEFDLSVRPTFSSATLTLEKGSVMLTALQTNRQVTLRPGQTATLDYATGSISVNESSDVLAVRSWQSDFLTFLDTPLPEVLARVGDVYGVRIMVADSARIGGFTGALPMHDLDETLTIIGKAYGMKAMRKGNHVRLQAVR